MNCENFAGHFGKKKQFRPWDKNISSNNSDGKEEMEECGEHSSKACTQARFYSQKWFYGSAVFLTLNV